MKKQLTTLFLLIIAHSSIWGQFNFEATGTKSGRRFYLRTRNYIERPLDIGLMHCVNLQQFALTKRADALHNFRT